VAEPLGLFDPEMRPEGWFGPDLVIEGWYSEDMVPATSGGTTYPGTASITAIATASGHV